MNDAALEILWSSEAVCEGCGADPRDPTHGVLDGWFFDQVMVPGDPEPLIYAVVRCPACW